MGSVLAGQVGFQGELVNDVVGGLFQNDLFLDKALLAITSTELEL
jgi:hypothetical protein